MMITSRRYGCVASAMRIIPASRSHRYQIFMPVMESDGRDDASLPLMMAAQPASAAIE